MSNLKYFRYRIYPNKEQTGKINQMLGNARFIYNWALSERIKAYAKDKTNISAFTLMKQVANLKKQPEYEWLQLSVAQGLQNAIVNMEKAFTRFFREKKGFPQFKSKKNKRQSVSFPQNTKINFEANRVWLQKLKWIPTRISRTFEGKIKITTLIKTSTNKYFVSILVELPEITIKQKPIKKETAVAIDTGIKTFATFSDGKTIDNPKHLKQSLGKLKILQKRASKKVKGSNNRKKANFRVALIHEHIANQRQDFLHKLTTQIANEYDTVIVEDLNIAGMVKNHCLAQSIADLGLGNFYKLLEYKLADRCKNFVKIGKFEPSSKLCSVCGFIKKDLKLSDREWVCPECKTKHDRDFNASLNILNFGLKKQNLLNRAGTVRRASGDCVRLIYKQWSAKEEA